MGTILIVILILTSSAHYTHGLTARAGDTIPAVELDWFF
jgi:hypothetical protein